MFALHMDLAASLSCPGPVRLAAGYCLICVSGSYRALHVKNLGHDRHSKAPPGA